MKCVVLKSNSNDRYAITCDVITYHLVHFVSIWVINKCQSGIDFFYKRRNISPVLLIKYRCPVQCFTEKHYDESELCKVYTLECQQGDEICFRYDGSDGE